MQIAYHGGRIREASKPGKSRRVLEVLDLQKTQPEKHGEPRVHEWLRQMSTQQREFVEWLLDHGEIDALYSALHIEHEKT
jgi:hypothetical protein